MVERCQRFQSRYYGHVDSFFAQTFHECEVFAVVEEHLRHYILCPGVHLCLQVLDVGFHVHRLVVFFRIPGHTVCERFSEHLVLYPSEQLSVVEAVYLLAEVNGVCMSFRRRNESVVAFGFVSS